MVIVTEVSLMWLRAYRDRGVSGVAQQQVTAAAGSEALVLGSPIWRSGDAGAGAVWEGAEEGRAGTVVGQGGAVGAVGAVSVVGGGGMGSGRGDRWEREVQRQQAVARGEAHGARKSVGAVESVKAAGAGGLRQSWFKRQLLGESSGSDDEGVGAVGGGGLARAGGNTSTSSAQSPAPSAQAAAARERERERVREMVRKAELLCYFYI